MFIEHLPHNDEENIYNLCPPRANIVLALTWASYFTLSIPIKHRWCLFHCVDKFKWDNKYVVHGTET